MVSSTDQEGEKQMKILFIIGLIIVAFLVREGRENQNYGTKNRGVKEKDYDAMTFFHPMENETGKQTERFSKDPEDYRKEGLELEQQGKYEEAFMKYEEAANMEDTKSMLLIARMYLSGDFRPVDSLNLPQSLLQYFRGICRSKNDRTIIAHLNG